MPERVKIRFDDAENESLVEPPAKRQKVKKELSNNRVPPQGNPKKDSRPSSYPIKSSPKTSALRIRADALLKSRQKLPIWNQSRPIQEALNNGKDVLLLVGETGSGKSTQVAQFLVDEAWAQRKGSVGGCIAITEPRKVAAVSLARRVAEEAGTPLGSSSPISTVGYHVRFDKSVSPNTKIKFLTEGMLLQEMLRDPWLRQYSAVIVDEVHERNVNVDLILGFLRNILISDKKGRDGLPLKIVAMSATADLEGLQAFFGGDSRDDVKDPVTTGVSRARSQSPQSGKEVSCSDGDISTCHIQGRQYPVKIRYAPSSVDDIIDASFRLIFKINYSEPLPGDILVFLTGREAVESLAKLVNDWSRGLQKGVPQLLALPLFASLSQNSQQRVFLPAPKRTRKVIVATNIAETSITVPGVRHVIDCGKSKVKQYRSQLGLESLLCKAVSQDAATQRRGRAGREAPGTCYRMYTEDAYNNLEKATVPEILRCDLAQAILAMKAKGIDEPWQFPLLDAPPLKGVSKGLEQLFQLGVVDGQGKITRLGEQMARLPLSPPLARVFMAAAASPEDCLAEVIDIISCLCVEAIFSQPSNEEEGEKAATARGSLIRREGDHLTLLAAIQAYTKEQTDRKAWCESHLISHRAMKGAWNIRKQLRTQAGLMKLSSSLDASSSSEPSRSITTEEHASAILQCILSGYVMRTAVLCSDGKYRTCDGRHEISIHPSSVLFGKKVEAIVYGEHVFTNQSWARNVSAVQTQWIENVLCEN